MFIGRQSELAQLNELCEQSGFQMPVIYGRRRVGKTRLIQEFCQNKKHIFYVAIEQNDKEALRLFSEALVSQTGDQQSLFIEHFSSWEAAFKYLGFLAQKDRLILVIDEYPYLASGNSSIASILQKAIDQVFLQSQLFLILCGSSMSFMENQVLDYKSPLYGRRTAQFKILPLDYWDSSQFLLQWTPMERLYGYAVAGGIPQYLLAISTSKTFKCAVIRNFLTSSGTLFEEPMNLMKQETREPATYNSIIRAIAEGASRQVEISNYMQEESKKTAIYLRALLDLGILAKEYSLGHDNKHKVIYKIKDQLFRFWYKFIPEVLPMIEMGLSQEAYAQKIEPRFSQYFGLVFEEICRQYLIRQNRNHQLGSLYHEFGSWWGTNPELKIEEEIDIVASNDSAALFAECKWKNEPIGISELETLQRRAQLTQKGKTAEFYLFSNSGFSDELLKKQGQTLHLVPYDNLLRCQATQPEIDL